MTLTPLKVAAGLGALFLLVVGGGFLWLGAPGTPPVPQMVHHDLPPERFVAPAQATLPQATLPALPLPPAPAAQPAAVQPGAARPATAQPGAGH
ncbi:hypothetical protein [Acidomonas methanolica]|uniref:hypothetical protein n=1 Tax=Acidomonas methanolica TaxID=437 RepID=UPI00211A4AD1|nr:hypothetical protein [Acidomonas methanolica]MCQ9155385.1 hypothetical protein [Acidomonas methanolica]